MTNLLATLPATQVVAEIKSALRQGLAEHSALALEKVEVRLKTLAEKSAGAGVKLTVPLINFEFEGGGDLMEESVQILDLILVPPVSPAVKGRGLEAVSIHEQLVGGIRAIAELVEHAEGGEPELAMAASGVELNFTLTAEGEVSLIARAGGKRALTHTIKLHFREG